MALVLSSKKFGKRGNKEVDAVGDRLGEVGIGAKLLAEADEDQRLNEAVYVASHRLALLGRRILCVKCHPFRSCRQAGWPHLVLYSGLRDFLHPFLGSGDHAGCLHSTHPVVTVAAV